MRTQVLRTSGEQFPGNSAAVETRLSFQSEIFLTPIFLRFLVPKSQLPSCEKEIHTCLLLLNSSSRSCILEIHRMTRVALL